MIQNYLSTCEASSVYHLCATLKLLIKTNVWNLLVPAHTHHNQDSFIIWFIAKES